MKQIVFFIGSLETGGAQRQFSLLAEKLCTQYTMTLITLYPEGQYWEEMVQNKKVKLVSLFKKKGRLSIIKLLIAIYRLRKFLCKEKINLVISALYISDLIAFLATRFLPVKLVWSLRASNLKLDFKRAIPFKLCTFFSSSVDFIISNSESGLWHHEKMGYKIRKYSIIPNGIDTEKFHPDVDLRLEFRKKFGYSENDIVIGAVGRLHPMKDYPTFLKAITLCTLQNCTFICVGEGLEAYKKELKDIALTYNITHKIKWIDSYQNMAEVYNGIDLFTLASLNGEGFPNVLGEAMACTKPCIVTDVGDSKMILGNCGLVIPSMDPLALSQAWAEIIQKDLINLGNCAQRRIKENFSISHLINKTNHVIFQLL